MKYEHTLADVAKAWRNGDLTKTTDASKERKFVVYGVNKGGTPLRVGAPIKIAGFSTSLDYDKAYRKMLNGDLAVRIETGKHARTLDPIRPNRFGRIEGIVYAVVAFSDAAHEFCDASFESCENGAYKILARSGYRDSKAVCALKPVSVRSVEGKTGIYTELDEETLEDVDVYLDFYAAPEKVERYSEEEEEDPESASESSNGSESSDESDEEEEFEPTEDDETELFVPEYTKSSRFTQVVKVSGEEIDNPRKTFYDEEEEEDVPVKLGDGFKNRWRGFEAQLGSLPAPDDEEDEDAEENAALDASGGSDSSGGSDGGEDEDSEEFDFELTKGFNTLAAQEPLGIELRELSDNEKELCADEDYPLEKTKIALLKVRTEKIKVVTDVRLVLSETASEDAIGVVVAVECEDGSVVETIKYLSLDITRDEALIIPKPEKEEEENDEEGETNNAA